jgi:hypothetical protein
VQYHQSRIDRNARQPSREARPSVEIPNVQEGSQEGILQRIFGVFAAFGNPINPGEKCLPKGFTQLFESRCSTLFLRPPLAFLQLSPKPPEWHPGICFARSMNACWRLACFLPPRRSRFTGRTMRESIRVCITTSNDFSLPPQVVARVPLWSNQGPRSGCVVEKRPLDGQSFLPLRHISIRASVFASPSLESESKVENYRRFFPGSNSLSVSNRRKQKPVRDVAPALCAG